MAEDFDKDIYYGHKPDPKKPQYNLVSGQLIPIQFVQVEAFKHPESSESSPVAEVADEIERDRHAIQESLDPYNEELTEEVLDLIYRGAYKKAYRLSQEAGINVLNHPRLLTILEDEIRDVLIEGVRKPTERYFKLFYLLGRNFDLNIIPGLKDFLHSVFDYYFKNCWPNSALTPLIKLVRIFGDQMDFDYSIEELEAMDLG